MARRQRQVITAADRLTIVQVLANDTDPDGDAISLDTVTQPANGTATANADGTVSYVPNAGFSGVDIFTYSILDANGLPCAALVTVTVAAPGVTIAQNPPEAHNDKQITRPDTPIAIPVLGNDFDADGDTLTITRVTSPTAGNVVQNADGTITYTPNPGYIGTDLFSYTIDDGNGGTSTATVVVEISGPPEPRPDAEITPEDTPVTVTVLTNDTDPENKPLTVTGVDATTPNGGTATINPDGTIEYTPATNFNGFDTFTYTVTDDAGNTATSTVTVNVDPVNDVPIAEDDSFTIAEDTPSPPRFTATTLEPVTAESRGPSPFRRRAAR